MTTRADVDRGRRCETLEEFARCSAMGPSPSSAGLRYYPEFYGPSERPGFRARRSRGDKGEVVTAWPDGRLFRTQGECDDAAVEDAARGTGQNGRGGPVRLPALENRARGPSRGQEVHAGGCVSASIPGSSIRVLVGLGNVSARPGEGVKS